MHTSHSSIDPFARSALHRASARVLPQWLDSHQIIDGACATTICPHQFYSYFSLITDHEVISSSEKESIVVVACPVSPNKLCTPCCDWFICCRLGSIPNGADSMVKYVVSFFSPRWQLWIVSSVLDGTKYPSLPW